MYGTCTYKPQTLIALKSDPEICLHDNFYDPQDSTMLQHSQSACCISHLAAMFNMNADWGALHSGRQVEMPAKTAREQREALISLTPRHFRKERESLELGFC